MFASHYYLTAGHNSVLPRYGSGSDSSLLFPPQEAKSGLLGGPGRALKDAHSLRSFGMTQLKRVWANAKLTLRPPVLSLVCM